jgi:hypothetical protein
MKNPMVYYAIIGLGVVALLGGIYLVATATAANPHHTTIPAAFIIGAVLVIGGVVGWFVMKPKAAK